MDGTLGEAPHHHESPERTGGPLDVIEAIFTTRAQRLLKPDAIPDEVIWEILDAAIRGPSSGNRQRWGWVVVTDPSTKQLIGHWYLEAWNELSESRRAKLQRFLGRALPTRDAGTHESVGNVADPNLRAGIHLAHHIAEAPVWIFAVMREIRGEPTIVDGADLFGAVQNLMLAARRHSVGSTLTMLHRRKEREVGRLLGLPDDARAIALIPLGYPRSGRFTVARRGPVESVTHWERWGVRRERSLGSAPAADPSAPSAVTVSVTAERTDSDARLASS
jgi:nitroreductase